MSTTTAIPNGLNTSTQTEASNDKPERDRMGRFAPGNKGGPGNPFARRSAMLRQAMLDAVTPNDLQVIVRKVIQMAGEGDVAVARLVLAYAVGKPDKAVDPDTLDVQEFQLWQQSAVASQQLSGVLNQVQAPLANTILRTTLPAIQETTAQRLAQDLRDPAPVAPDDAAPRHETQSAPGPKQERSTPENGRGGTPNPCRSERASRTVKETAPAEQDELSPALDLEEEQADWLLFFQEIARQIHEQQRQSMPGGEAPPITNGELRKPDEER